MNIGIIGLGLMGGSLARALKKTNKHTIYGFDISREAILKAKLISAIDHEIKDNEDYKKLDVVFVCLNIDVSINVIKEIYKYLKKDAILSDFTGVKSEIVNVYKEISNLRNDINLISVHPMAGREFSGISHSAIDLYKGANILFIPVHNSFDAFLNLKSIFVDLNSKSIITTNAEKHDRIIAYTSQLPHILSNAYIKEERLKESPGYTAGSFRDFTRVSKINPNMWIPLFLQNKKDILECIANFKNNLELIEEAIKNDDEHLLYKLLKKGNDLKIDIDKVKV